jgi:hypothetical protein
MNADLDLHAFPTRISAGGIILLEADGPEGTYDVEWRVEGPARLTHEDVSIAILGETTVATGPVELTADQHRIRATLDTAPLVPGSWTVMIRLTAVAGDGDDGEREVHAGLVSEIEISPRPFAAGDNVAVTMQRAAVLPTADQALWAVIRNSTNKLGFHSYSRFMDLVMCGRPRWNGSGNGNGNGGPRPLREREREEFRRVSQRTALPFPNVESYRLLKVATEVFMMLHCGVEPDFAAMNLADESRRFNRQVAPGDLQAYWADYLTRVYVDDGGEDAFEILPYLELIRLKLQEVPLVRDGFADDDAAACYGILAEKLARPCFLELIWSYWHEEGMMVQAINAVTWRFQNRPNRSGGRDPLQALEIDPLRPLNNLLWGYIQDEQHRLTVARRAYEYDHEYGMKLVGKAVPHVRGADSRSRFVEAFHHLLALCTVFYQQDDDTTVIADGFPVLNGLKETHLLITQGAHNQYGDLPWVARMEGLMQQWLLSRPEMREFLPSRTMVAYPETWMDRVESMKSLQGWTDTSILHFRDLGVFGEQILLGIRYGAWTTVIEPEQAANWARYFRAEIQAYHHAYRAATGVDLAAESDATIPAIHLQRRLVGQRNGR